MRLIEVDPVSWTPICLSFEVHDVKEAPIQRKSFSISWKRSLSPVA